MTFLSPDRLDEALELVSAPNAAPVILGTEQEPLGVLIPVALFHVVAPALDAAQLEITAGLRANPAQDPGAAEALADELGIDPDRLQAIRDAQAAEGFDPDVNERP